MTHEVVVTGMGVAAEIGEGLSAFEAALRSGKSGFSAGDGMGAPVVSRLAMVDFDERLFRLTLPDGLVLRAKRVARRSPRVLQIALVMALEAWQHAGLVGASMPPEKIDLLVAGHNFGQGLQIRVAEKYGVNPEYVLARHALQFMDTDYLGVISEVLELRGEGCTIGGASASGNVALLQAWRQIGSGFSSLALVVGPPAELSALEVHAFRNLGAMGGSRFAATPDQACRPFDIDREGFILGEGSACLVLESAESARRRGAKVFGRVAGGALCLDGNRLADPSVAGETRTMRQALQTAHMAPEAVDYVNAHATSSLLGDEVEAKALWEVFADAMPWINATKGLTGHCLFSASLVEAVAVLLQLRGGFLHPNRNLARPLDERLRFVGATACETGCEIALSNAFGFGGINTSIIFQR